MKLIMENWRSFLSEEIPFHNSPDEDGPGRNNFISFTDTEQYTISGNTHGQLSHTIKHYMEFEPEQTKEALSKALETAKSFDSFFLKAVNNSKTISSGEQAKTQANLNSMLNTFDLINDKIMNKNNLTQEESKITNFILPLNEEYENLIKSYMSNSVNIEEVQDVNEILNLIKQKKIIRFIGSYKNNPVEYFFNPSDTGLVANNNNKIATLFRIDKKGANLGKVAKYFSRGVELKNKAFKEALASFVSKSPPQQQQKKKKQPRQQQQQSQNPVEFAKQLSSRGLPKEKIKDIIMKKFNKNDAAADGILKGARIA